MEQISKIEEKLEMLTEVQRSKIYEYARMANRETLEEICPALLRLALDSEKGKLKNQLGMVIFHLQKNERINTVIGLQKLLDAGLLVNPEGTFKILENADKGARELAKKIKSIL